MRIHHLPIILSLILAACGGRDAASDLAARKELVNRYVAIWNGDSPGELDSLLTSGYVRRTSAPGGPANSPEELKTVIAQMRRDVPDLHVEIEEVLVSGEDAVFRWQCKGTDTGPGDFPPTNKRFISTGLTWLRFEGNRIAKEWSGTDQLDILLQLGFRVVPPEGKE